MEKNKKKKSRLKQIRRLLLLGEVLRPLDLSLSREIKKSRYLDQKMTRQ